MEPALQIIREHRDIAQREIERIKREIDKRHNEMKIAQAAQDAAVKQLRDFEVEFRAHERLLSSIRSPFLSRTF
jgi:hypothetical protein